VLLDCRFSCPSSTIPRYKYCFEVPWNSKSWNYARQLEIDPLNKYATFTDLWNKEQAVPPRGLKNIIVDLTFDVNNDRRQGAGVCLMSTWPMFLRIVLLWYYILKKNVAYSIPSQIQLSRDMGYTRGISQLRGWNTRESVSLNKAQYELSLSGLSWHEWFVSRLKATGFEPPKAEPDLWIYPLVDSSCYKLIFCVCWWACGWPEGLKGILWIGKYFFKLQESGPISFAVGFDFEWEEYGTLCMAPRQYDESMVI